MRTFPIALLILAGYALAQPPAPGPGRAAFPPVVIGASAPVPPEVAIPRHTPEELTQVNDALTKWIASNKSPNKAVLQKFDFKLAGGRGVELRIAHNDKEILDTLIKEAKDGKFKDKHLVLMICNEKTDKEAFAKLIEQRGGTILSKPDANALKVRAPDGNIFEIVETGGFEKYKQKAAEAAH